MHLSLLLPQLIWPEPEDRSALEQLPSPALDWLLAHGTFERGPSRPYEYSLAAIFGLDASAPLGALRLLGESTITPEADAREGYWLCADPVHLRFHHERIILADAGAFELSEDEVSTLAGELNREFGDIGQFHVGDARRWYVRLNYHASLPSAPLSAVSGRRVEGELPNESQASKLRSWINEIQMFLHGHPVNAARAKEGKPAVNSLWLWGGGPLPEIISADHNGVWARDPLARGLARCCGIPVHPQPAHLEALLAHAAPDGTQLVVLDDILAPVLYDDSRAWRDVMVRLEENWFAPLRSAIGRKVESATLIAPTIYGELVWEVRGAARWQFWRRPKPIATLAKELAQ